MIESVSIFDVLSNIKQDNPFVLKEDMDSVIKSTLSNGVTYKNTNIKVVGSDPYHNKISNREAVFYYYICPHCQKRCRKLYYIPQGVKKRSGVLCRYCGNIRGSRADTSKNRLHNSYYSLMRILMGGITQKKKHQLLSSVINNATKSSPDTRDHYIAVVMSTFQKFLISKLTSGEGKEYNRAVKDMLEVIRTLKSTLYFNQADRNTRK